jgi:murein DD-endopeptidase MepM/ murein hydrolase activator NlpD/triacylglycerol esterase/lipase EstA (alpha/beta hydrolase family)
MVPARPSFRPFRLRPRRRRHARRASGLRQLQRELRRWRRRPVFAAARPASAALVLAITTAALSPAAAAGARARQADPPAPTYSPPVSAPIADPFRPPAGPYGAGNRGIEYDTEPGDPVRASADGTVVFAGPVAGTLHVTLRHVDGVRTSYSFLGAVDVVLGQGVRAGDQVGIAGERLHFGARSGDAYFDPAFLFVGGEVEVELLPFEIPPGSTPQAEARALAQLAFDGGGGVGFPGVGAALGWLYDRARSTATYATQLNLPARGLGLAADLGARLFLHGPCSEGPPLAAPVRDQDRVAITVAGLGSSSSNGSIDELRTADLGYDEDRVVRFSYAGGRVPRSAVALGDLASRAYETGASQGDLRAAARRLADLVQDVAASDPDATIDLFAHSQGGVVARLALLELVERGAALDRLGVVTTLGTPHKGSDVATAVVGAGTTLTGNLGLRAADAFLGGGIDHDAAAVRQLAENSDVMRELARVGVPEGVRLVSIAARGDLAVAAPNTEVAGATNVTVAVSGWSAHADLVASDEATAEMARALAGQPPACESWRDVVADVAVGHGISFAEDQIGAAALAELP